jgi:hypothetical protein
LIQEKQLKLEAKCLKNLEVTRDIRIL